MSVRSLIWSKSGSPRRGRSLVLALLLFLGGAAGLGAQESSAQGEAPQEIKFEVLDVTTGSGSKSLGDNSEIKIEVLDDQKTPQTKDAPARPPEEKVGAAPAKKAPAPTSADKKDAKATRGGKSGAGKASATKARPEAQQEDDTPRPTIVESLDQWRYQTLASYNYNIVSMPDPFLPIKEVRGSPEDMGAAIDPNEDKLPPLLRLELNQLKLVAITVLSGGRGPALASFEDGAGNSYILRNGERIGRRQGRITRITPDTVTVEEPAGIAGNPPRITNIRLNVTSSDGLTRSPEAGQDGSGAQ